MNVAGTQVGLALMLCILALGFSAIIDSLSAVFDIIRVAGALYLIYLGWKLWRANGQLIGPTSGVIKSRSMRDYFWQGFLVIWSNPKALFFFGAFIPQFVVPTRAAAPQVIMLGLTFMLVGALFDGAYALAAGKTGSLLGFKHIRLLERVSGTCLLGGGVWLLLKRGS